MMRWTAEEKMPALNERAALATAGASSLPISDNRQFDRAYSRNQPPDSQFA